MIYIRYRYSDYKIIIAEGRDFHTDKLLTIGANLRS